MKYLKEAKDFTEDIVFTDWLSPDEKYCIFLDELYDIKSKKNLGDIWKNPDNLVLFLEHSYKTSNLKQNIKEEASKVFGKLILSENKVDFTPLKGLIKQYIKEEKSIWGSFTKWLSDTGKSTWEGLSDFAVDSWEGIKEYGVAISKGDWDEVMRLAKRGSKWLARKIRQAVYSPVGIVVDAILIATGIGKLAQVGVWAIVVALDIYEFTTGDYEHPDDPTWMRILFFAIDVIGLVMAGAAAKAARQTARLATLGLHTDAEVAAAVAKNPALLSYLETAAKSIPKASSTLKAASGSIKGGSKLAKFFKGALSGMGKFFSWLLDGLLRLISPKAVWAGTKAGVIVGGIGTAGEYFKTDEDTMTALQDNEIDNYVASVEKGDANYDEMLTKGV